MKDFTLTPILIPNRLPIMRILLSVLCAVVLSSIPLFANESLKGYPDGHQWFSGNGSPTWEVDVAENDFYTTNVIGERIYQELRRIDADQPRLGSRLIPAETEWIEDLHRKGIIRRVRFLRQQGEKDASSLRSASLFQIEEMATKTTPTCLSSYLG